MRDMGGKIVGLVVGYQWGGCPDIHRELSGGKLSGLDAIGLWPLSRKPGCAEEPRGLKPPEPKYAEEPEEPKSQST